MFALFFTTSLTTIEPCSGTRTCIFFFFYNPIIENAITFFSFFWYSWIFVCRLFQNNFIADECNTSLFLRFDTLSPLRFDIALLLRFNTSSPLCFDTVLLLCFDTVLLLRFDTVLLLRFDTALLIHRVATLLQHCVVSLLWHCIASSLQNTTLLLRLATLICL